MLLMAVLFLPADALHEPGAFDRCEPVGLFGAIRKVVQGHETQGHRRKPFQEE